MYCPNCGHEIPEGGEFCPECGLKLHIHLLRDQQTSSDRENLSSLVEQFQSTGNGDIFRQIYDRTYQKYYNTVYSRTRDASLTEDILQDSYLDCYTKIGQLRDPSKFNSWMLSILNSRISHAYNNKFASHEMQDSVTEDEEGNQTSFLESQEDTTVLHLPENYSEDRELKRLLQQSVASLTPDQQTAIKLYYYEQLPQKEIAEFMQVPENTVKTYLSRGRKKLNADVRRYADQYGLKLVPVAAVPFALYLFGDEVHAAEVTHDPYSMPDNQKVNETRWGGRSAAAHTAAHAAGTHMAGRVAAILIAAAAAGGVAGGVFAEQRIAETRQTASAAAGTSSESEAGNSSDAVSSEGAETGDDSTSSRLWIQDYLNYIDNNDTSQNSDAATIRFNLIDVDGDSVPEVYLNDALVFAPHETGCLLTWHDGMIDSLQLGYSFVYNEGTNRIWSDNYTNAGGEGWGGFSYLMIYSIEGGKWNRLDEFGGSGFFGDNYSSSTPLSYRYTLNDEDTTPEAMLAAARADCGDAFQVEMMSSDMDANGLNAEEGMPVPVNGNLAEAAYSRNELEAAMNAWNP